MIRKAGSDERKEVVNLFSGIDDSMIIAYRQGYMGDAFIDRYPDPTVGMMSSGEYTFFGGDANSKEAEELVKAVFQLIPGNETTATFAESEPDWEKTLLSVPENNPKSVPRFGIVQRDYDFDQKKLRSFVEALPEGYEIKEFDMDLYDQAMSEDWSKEFCEIFDSGEDYLKRGFGIAAVQDGKLISATSTQTVYDGGTEIQIATHPDYRKRGLAKPTAAAFILECIKRNMRPHWDAANKISLRIALDLGYEYRGEYTTVKMEIGDGS